MLAGSGLNIYPRDRDTERIAFILRIFYKTVGLSLKQSDHISASLKLLSNRLVSLVRILTYSTNGGVLGIRYEFYAMGMVLTAFA